MADNITLPCTGTGTANVVVATDDAGSAQYQKVKIADGAADSTAMIGGDATNGLDVDVTRLPALVAGTANIGDVDVLTLPALVAGTANIGDVDIASITAGDTVIGRVKLTDGTEVASVDASNRLEVAVGNTPTVTANLGSIADVATQTTLSALNTKVTACNTGAVVVSSGAITANLGTIADVATQTTLNSLNGKVTACNTGAVVVSSGTITVSTISSGMTPGTGATDLGKAEDTPLSAGATGVMALAVRSAAPTDRSAGPTDDDYEPLGVNEVGALWVTPTHSANGGATTYNASSSDGATALTNSPQAIKAGAGNLIGYYIYNPNSVAAFVQFYNVASGSVTVGTTNPQFMLTIPATSGANLWMPGGIAFSTAITWAATSTAGGSGAPTTALDAVCWYK